MQYLATLSARFLKKDLIRKPLSTRFVPEIDGLRFFAIALVFMHHFSWYIVEKCDGGVAFKDHPLIRYLLHHGHFGVQLFFIISGFVLALPFAAGKKPEMSSYFARRLTRLEPPYLLTLLLMYLGLVLFTSQTAGELLPRLAMSALYLHNLGYGEPSRINVVAWSLEIEVQFYLLAPLLAAFLFSGAAALRRTKMAIAIVGATLLGSRAHLFPLLHLSLLGHLHYFLLGFLLADLYLQQLLTLSKGYGWNILAAILFPLLIVTCNLPSTVVAFILPVHLFLLVVSVLKSRAASRLFSTPTVVALGGMCYSIYLIHGYLIALLFRVTGSISSQSLLVTLLIQTFLIVPPVLLVCVLFFVIVERPCMDRQWPAKLASFLRSKRTEKGGASRVGEPLATSSRAIPDIHGLRSDRPIQTYP